MKLNSRRCHPYHGYLSPSSKNKPRNSGDILTGRKTFVKFQTVPKLRCQTEVTSGQTQAKRQIKKSLESLERRSSGQWFDSGLIRGHFCLE